jgi:AcrR family transcriptional regulator
VEAINQAIIAAAREHFLSSGFEATPMEAIAATAGVSKGTVYARYPTKEALLRTVLVEQLAAWQAHEVRRMAPLPADFRMRLKQHARSILEALGSEKMQAFEALVSGTGSPASEFARALYETAHRMTVETLAQVIEDGTRGEPDAPRAPMRVAEILMAMLYGWYSANEPLRRVTPSAAHAFADEAIEILFAGRRAW